MLVLYKKDGLLNHSNDLYRAAFYNVETRFLVSRDSDVLSLSNMYQTDQGNECIDGEPEEKLIEDRLRVNRKREELPVWDKTCIEDIEWIRKQIQELKIIYDSCVGIEEAISSYIVCVVKMLNGLVQIRSSQQHKYEREILFEPMKVFTDYFIKLTEDVLDKRVSIDAKNKLIQDIESAVCRVSDIYENALNRTANTDKQMFMSLPVNASLYELSPKLYSHYADIVREMRYLFDKENQYAIFLNPTLKRTLKEEILFRVRKEKGKVVVVDIPVGTMDHYDFLPLCLVHEIFHVLTSVERKRKKRAVMMWMVLSTQIESMIFQGIQFSDRREIDADMKFVLFQEWFPGSRDEINSLLKIREEDRSFYAVRINLEISRTIRMDLYQVESRAFKDMRMVAERLESKYKGAANSDGLSYLSLMESYEKLKKNIRIILSKNQIAYLVKKLTHLFKETYADVASLLVVPNLKQSYGPAFLKSIQFDMDEEELKKDEYRQLRQTLVEIVIRNDRKSIFDGNRLTAGALVEYRALKEQIVEKQSLNKMEAGGKKSDGKKGEKEENLSLQVKATHVIINEILFQSYLDYLFDCKSAIIQRLENFGEDDASHWESLKDKVLMGTKCGLIDLYQAYEKYQYSS